MEPLQRGRASLNESVCPVCESPIDSACTECPECGTVLRHTCRGCGAHTDPSMACCPSCGVKLLCPDCGETLDSDRCENCAKEEEPDPFEQEFDIGVELMDEQEYQAAADSFTSYLAKCEKGIERDSAVINRGYCFFHVRKFSEAEKDFTDALQLQADTQLRFLRGQARMHQGNAQGAIEDFTSVLSEEPDRLELLIHRGRAAQAAERHEDALADFAAYLDAQPEDPDAHFCKSEALLALKKPREALAELILARDYGSEKADETLRMLAGKI